MARPVHISDADLDAIGLRRLRMASGISVEELARSIDMAPDFVRSLEEGELPVTRPAALAIRFVLDRI